MRQLEELEAAGDFEELKEGGKRYTILQPEWVDELRGSPAVGR